MLNEKMPPCNIEAEKSVLAAIFLDPASITRVSDFLRPDDFYNNKHRLIYGAMLALDAEHIPIDFITLEEELERRGQLKIVGYEASELLDRPLSTSNIEHYAQSIREMHQLRDVIKVATQMVTNAYARDPQTVTLAAEAIYNIEQGKRVTRVTSIGDAVGRYMDKLNTIHERRQRGIVTGVPTGFKVVDKVLGGLQPSDLIVLAARPANGKTSWCLNVGHHVMGHSSEQGYNVLMFSLEMGEEQLVRRMISMESRIDQTRLRTADIEKEEWEPLVRAAERIAQGRMWIDDTPGISLAEMRSRARRIQSEHGLGLIIVDYMQLMKATQADGRLAENRVQEVSLLSRGLKELARELNVPVLALAQLSRAVEQRADKLPQLSDLRESGTIEQDSDVVMFIHPDTSIPATAAGSIVNIIVAKHRNGPTGIAPLRFRPELTRFYDIDDREGQCVESYMDEYDQEEDEE